MLCGGRYISKWLPQNLQADQNVFSKEIYISKSHANPQNFLSGSE